MDGTQKDEMQNWKKLLIMDSSLNKLFDKNLKIKDFVEDQILLSDHTRISHIYSKLSTIKHALSKHIHKEVEIKHEAIEESFLKKCELSSASLNQSAEQAQKSQQRLQKLQGNRRMLKKYNDNYERVQQNLLTLQNINQVVEFSKNLDKYKITIRLLKTFMKDFKDFNQSKHDIGVGKFSPQAGEALNLAKVSKLLKQISSIENCHHQSLQQIKYYQNERQFVSNSKAILYAVSEKQLSRALRQFGSLEKQKQKDSQKIISEIESLFLIIHSISKLRDVLVSIVRQQLEDSGDRLKKLFKIQNIQEFKAYFYNSFTPQIIENSRILLRVEETLLECHLTQSLRSNNVQNLFEKYMDRLASYLGDLVKWNVEQQMKEKAPSDGQNQKNVIPNPLPPSAHRFSSELSKLSQGVTQPSTEKASLALKYPFLLGGVHELTTLIHCEVIGISSLCLYSMPRKQESLMLSLTKLSTFFWQSVDILFSSSVAFSPHNIEALFSLIEDGQMMSNLVEKMIILIEKSVDSCSSQKQHSNSQIQSDQNQESALKQNNTNLSEMIRLIDDLKVLSKYDDPEQLVSHLHRIKKLRSKV